MGCGASRNASEHGPWTKRTFAWGMGLRLARGTPLLPYISCIRLYERRCHLGVLKLVSRV